MTKKSKLSPEDLYQLKEDIKLSELIDGDQHHMYLICTFIWEADYYEADLEFIEEDSESARILEYAINEEIIDTIIGEVFRIEGEIYYNKYTEEITYDINIILHTEIQNKDNIFKLLN